MRSIGHIKETKNKGVYRVVLSVGRDAKGRRLRQWVTVKGSRRDAEKRLAELQHEYQSGTFIKPGKMTVERFFNRWLQDYADPNLSPKTVEGYEQIINHYIIPRFGNCVLGQLKPPDILSFYSDELKGGLSPQTVRHHHTLLHKAMNSAAEWGLIAINPVNAVRPPRAKHIEIQTWNEAEVSQFLKTAQDSQYYALFHTALYTGMRRSELLGLKWADIDLLLGQIFVTRGLHHLKDGSYVFTQPKSAKSRRTIALSPSAILTLHEYHDKMAMDRAIIGIPLTEQDLVFSHPGGKPYRPNSISRTWQNIAAKAGVKVIRLHDARHTHASLMLKQGIHPKIVSERLGHSSITITLDTYSHVTPGLQEAAAMSFDKAIEKARVEIG